MKKLFSMMLGVSLVLGSGALSFAQEKKEEKKEGEGEKKPSR